MALKVPEGEVNGTSGLQTESRQIIWKPQQAMASSLRIAHVWKSPAIMALKVPEGGSACPYVFSPQQAMVSSLRSAHPWNPPAAMALAPKIGYARLPEAVVSPAGDGVVAAQPATVGAAGGCGLEGA